MKSSTFRKIAARAASFDRKNVATKIKATDETGAKCSMSLVGIGEDGKDGCAALAEKQLPDDVRLSRSLALEATQQQSVKGGDKIVALASVYALFGDDDTAEAILETGTVSRVAKEGDEISEAKEPGSDRLTPPVDSPKKGRRAVKTINADNGDVTVTSN